MKKIRCKKGVSHHLEMVVAFILFISFVLFLLLYIKPYERDVLTDSVFIGLHASFEERVSSNLTKVFVKEEDDGCYSFELGGVVADGNSLVKDALTGSKIDSALSGGSVVFDSTSGTGFYIFISPEFEMGTGCGGSVVSDSYEIGSVYNIVLISNKSLWQLKEEYDTNYDSLKQDFGIPETADFGIRTLDSDCVMEKRIPNNVKVISKVYTHEFLTADGAIENKEFVLKVW